MNPKVDTNGEVLLSFTTIDTWYPAQIRIAFATLSGAELEARLIHLVELAEKATS
jgi:hypothetical protein